MTEENVTFTASLKKWMRENVRFRSDLDWATHLGVHQTTITRLRNMDDNELPALTLVISVLFIGGMPHEQLQSVVNQYYVASATQPIRGKSKTRTTEYQIPTVALTKRTDELPPQPISFSESLPKARKPVVMSGWLKDSQTF